MSQENRLMFNKLVDIDLQELAENRNVSSAAY